MINGIDDIGEALWEQALVNSKDFEIALEIAFGYEKFRSKLITNLGSKIYQHLVGKLSTSDFNDYFQVYPFSDGNCSEILDKLGGFGIEHKINKLYIGTESSVQGASNWIFGVKKPKIDFCFADNDLYDSINKKFGLGKKSDYYVWYKNCEGIYYDWKNKEAVLAIGNMLNDRVRFDRFASYYVDKIFELATIINDYTCSEKQ